MQRGKSRSNVWRGFAFSHTSGAGSQHVLYGGRQMAGVSRRGPLDRMNITSFQADAVQERLGRNVFASATETVT